MEDLEPGQRVVDVIYGDTAIKMVQDEKPIFTVERPGTGEKWEIYADGRATGFGDGPLWVFNGIALLKMKYEAQLALNGKTATHPPQ